MFSDAGLGTCTNALPRWRGFNINSYLSMGSRGYFPTEDFQVIRDWGFDFVRVPLNYRLWADFARPNGVHEDWLARIDRVVTLALEAGLHLSLSFHRAPGFTVSREGAEPRNLWRDEVALDQFLFHWRLFARRYADIPGQAISFNLVNEPPPVSNVMSLHDHNRVISAAVKAIRAVDADRLIIVDGLRWGRQPIADLAELGVAQSCRGYDPIALSHHGVRAEFGRGTPPPTWPGVEFKGLHWDRARLASLYEPWLALLQRGVGVHCGECGAANRTPHPAALAWLTDLFAVFKLHGIGWALWEFRGPFGVIDSGRSDVHYRRTSVGSVDEELLKLLQAS